MRNLLSLSDAGSVRFRFVPRAVCEDEHGAEEDDDEEEDEDDNVEEEEN